MQNDNDSSDTRSKRLLQEIREQVILVRSQYLSERGAGQVRPSTEQALRDVTIEYYEAIREHRGESVIAQDWDESGVAQVEELLEETTTVQRDRPGHGTAVEQAEVPLIQQVDPLVLVNLTRKMDDLCKRLGFSPAVNESTPRTEIDEELVEEVERWRQKTLE